MSEQVLDCVGVPDFFVTEAVMEDAGNGMVRTIRCIKRRGVLIPVVSYVTPAAAVLEVIPLVTNFSMEVLQSMAAARVH